MKIVRFKNLTECEQTVLPFLAQDLCRNNLPFRCFAGASEEAVQDPENVFGAVEKDGNIVAAFWQAGKDVPFGIATARTDVGQFLLHEVLATAPRTYTKLLSFPNIIEPLAQQYCLHTQQHITDRLEMQGYALQQLIEPPSPGKARFATASDLDRLVPWTQAFVVDCRFSPIPLEEARANCKKRLAAHQLWLYEVNSKAVAMCALNLVKNGEEDAFANVSLVYTPNDERRNGYAAALVASACAFYRARYPHLPIFLYADKTNPASTRAYQKIGFAAEFEYTEVRLAR